MQKERSRPDSLRKMAGTANLLTGCAIMANSSFCLGKSNKKWVSWGTNKNFAHEFQIKNEICFAYNPTCIKFA